MMMMEDEPGGGQCKGPLIKSGQLRSGSLSGLGLGGTGPPSIRFPERTGTHCCTGTALGHWQHTAELLSTGPGQSMSPSPSPALTFASSNETILHLFPLLLHHHLNEYPRDIREEQEHTTRHEQFFFPQFSVHYVVASSFSYLDGPFPPSFF